MAVWDDVITGQDREVFERAGFGGRQGLGPRPVVLVIDVTYGFVGDRPEPILHSIERFPTSCGEAGWQGVVQIEKFLRIARQKGVPVIYTIPGRPIGSAGATKRTGESEYEKELRSKLGQDPRVTIVQDIGPREEDIVISKLKASAFIGTPLLGYLIGLKVDTLLVTGCTTSGCVRATVVDGFSYNYRVGVVEECVWDRVQLSHKVNLFDMNGKYADVLPLEETMGYLSGLDLEKSTNTHQEVPRCQS